MYKEYENNLTLILKESFINEINQYINNKFNYIDLEDSEIYKLSEKISVLPLEYQNILFSKYYFNLTPLDTEEMFNITNARNKALYIEKLLSNFMGLEEEIINKNSFSKACRLLIDSTILNDYEIELDQTPNYSKKFKNNLKRLKITYKNPIRNILKKVATIILISSISISTILITNTNAKEKLYKWIIKSFPQFSIISSEHLESDEIADLSSLTINYIPENFKLENINKGRQLNIYEYTSKNNENIEIKFIKSSSKGKTYYDTENIKTNNIPFKNTEAYIWTNDKTTYLIWLQNGIEIHISSNIDQTEILKIGENINLNKEGVSK